MKEDGLTADTHRGGVTGHSPLSASASEGAQEKTGRAGDRASPAGTAPGRNLGSREGSWTEKGGMRQAVAWLDLGESCTSGHWLPEAGPAFWNAPPISWPLAAGGGRRAGVEDLHDLLVLTQESSCWAMGAPA